MRPTASASSCRPGLPSRTICGRGSGSAAGGGAAGRGRFAVDLVGAERWRGGLETLQPDLSRPEVALAWQAAWQALLRHRRLVGGGPLRDAVHARGLALARASRALERLRGRRGDPAAGRLRPRPDLRETI